MATAVSLPVHTTALTLDCSTANVKELRPFASCLRPVVSRYLAMFLNTQRRIILFSALGGDTSAWSHGRLWSLWTLLLLACLEQD